MFGNLNITHLSLSPPAGPLVAITAIDITMATEFLPESKTVEKLEEEGWREREDEKRGLGPLITQHDL